MNMYSKKGGQIFPSNINYIARHEQKHEVVNMILKLNTCKFTPNYLLNTYLIIQIRFNQICFSNLYYF
jgi:hypothetical protein